MVKNWQRAARAFGMAFPSLCVSVAGCAPEPEDPHADAWQGVIELEERVLAFELPGQLVAVDVDEGDVVDRGAPVARLDDRLERLGRDARAAEARAIRSELELVEAGSRPEDVRSLRASLAAAKATQSLADQTAVRIRGLRSKGVASIEDLDQAETNLATARARRTDLEAQLARLRKGARTQEISAAEARAAAADVARALADERIARHVLTAPDPGVVLDVHVEPGEFAQVGAPVATLADVTRPYIDVFVPQSELDGVEVGQPMWVEVDSHEQPFGGTVEHISRRTEFTPRFLFSPRERPNLVVRVRVRIEAPGGDLHAGLPAFVTSGGDAR
jgi:HlyD family secretion protein